MSNNTFTTNNNTAVSFPRATRFANVQPVEAFGDCVWQMLTADQTNDAVEVGFDETQPGGGPPLHIHTVEDELFWVQEGIFEFNVGGTKHIATPGTFVFAPRYQPHTFRCVSETAGRQLILTAPGNFGTFFRRCAAEFATGAPDFGRIVGISAEHGITYPSPEEAAAYVPPSEPLQPKLVLPQDGEIIAVDGSRIRPLLSAKETGGLYELVHLETASGAGSTSHQHTNEDEVLVILSGKYEFQLANEIVNVGPNDTIWAPKGHSHSFRVVSEEAGQMLSLVLPSSTQQ